MKNYPISCMAILGNGLTREEKLFPHFIKHLDSIVKLYNERPAEDKPLFAVVGKWSFWNRKGTSPSTTEAQEMYRHLLNSGIPQEAILIENQSEDTIGNALHLRTLLEKKGIKNVSIFCADHRIERAEYIFKVIFGEQFKLEFIAIPGIYNVNELEKQKTAQRILLEKQKTFIQTLLTVADPLEFLALDYQKQLESKDPLSDTSKAALGIVE